ncbi:MAG TPA: hypothetical protein VGM76_12400 [Lacipirellulaceae bacterium]|jgi:hypothetical protein
METTLHRQLKSHYAAADGALVEQRVGQYRIDVVIGRELVEIQLASLSAIRDKIAALVKRHDVRVVKPIVARKYLVKQQRAGGRIVSRRCSPKRQSVIDMFEELVHFTRVFPHRRLTLEVVLVEIEEWRVPGHGRRRRWRRGDQQTEDQRLLAIVGGEKFQTASDLCRMLPATLPCPFHTGHLAEGLSVQRWIAQRMAYCLRKTGAIEAVGKQRGAWLYEVVDAKAAA